MRLVFTLLVLFIISYMGIFSLLNDRMEHQKTIIYNDSQSVVENQYKIIISILRNLSNNTYNTLINKNNVKELFAKRDREGLYKLLENDYKNLKSFGFTQVHFHLPDNRSFLRMHQPKYFGDDLTNARYSVNYVNKNKKKIEGIEAGKVVPGYRFVYPLFFNDQYLGSVELSFGIHKIVTEMENVYDTHVHYLIKRDIYNEKVFENFKGLYTDSIEHIDYVKLDRNYQNKIHPWYDDKNIKKQLDKNFTQQQIFSVELNKDHKYSKELQHVLVTFMPIKNIEGDAISYFVFYSENLDLHIMGNKYTQIKVIVAIVLAVLFLLLYIFIVYKNKAVESKNKMAKFNNLLKQKVGQKTKELQKINESLEERIKLEVEQNQQKERQIFEQSKKAAMGEMIGNIAHQWRQPLNELAIRIQTLKQYQQMHMIDEDFILDFIKENKQTIDYMSNTIDDFRFFFKREKEKTFFMILPVVEKTLALLNASLEYNKISTSINAKEDFEFEGMQTELQQVLMNLINNAKDAIIDRNIENPSIKITIEKNKILIRDNAGGIYPENEDKIFDPYFTTKKDINGTGLGLYMSQVILEKNMDGRLYCQNDYPNGSTFVIEFE